MMLDPGQTGFAGDVIGGDPTDEVGPYDIRGASVRSLLCQLVVSSKGATWVAGGVREFVGANWTNTLWAVVEYDPTLH